MMLLETLSERNENSLIDVKCRLTKNARPSGANNILDALENRENTSAAHKAITAIVAKMRLWTWSVD